MIKHEFHFGDELGDFFAKELPIGISIHVGDIVGDIPGDSGKYFKSKFETSLFAVVKRTLYIDDDYLIVLDVVPYYEPS